MDRDPLEALASEFLERQRRGESPSISEYAARHPDLADAIRDLFPTIVAVERLKGDAEPASPGPTRLRTPRLERLGDFRIVREIGRGGMGIVYEAEQETLGRRVAVKVLPSSSLLDDKHLKRFRREARIAASLHHTNIVEVFGVGEDQGVHYFVMQYIDGVGLDLVVERYARRDEDPSRSGSLAATAVSMRQVVQGLRQRRDEPTAPVDTEAATMRFSEPGAPASGGVPGQREAEEPALSATRSLGPDHWHEAARVCLQVAEALAYAHGQGTLHRDIKPANLLVDEAGFVWITDFGLAKAVQSEDLTHSGAITGTLRYMAPEQFHGQTDERSDVYSLGLTLYELLALRPAFGETDRSQLIRAITQGDPPAPRRLVPGLPRDLETIVLKATARDPSHRYQKAAALAQDLRCFLEDRPIQARRASAAERLWRWSRRNPALAGLAATTALLTLLVAGVATVGYVRTRDALRGEALQRAKAEANAELAIEALDRIYERFSPSQIVPVSELTLEGDEGTTTTVEVPSPVVVSRDAAGLLEDMLAFYDRLARQGGDETLLGEKAAEANRRVGAIRQRLGQHDEAAAAYTRAIALYEELARSSTRDYVSAIARVRNELGQLLELRREWPEARQAHLEALTALESASMQEPARQDVRYELARTHYLLGRRPQTDSVSVEQVAPPGPPSQGPQQQPPGGEPALGLPPPEAGKGPFERPPRRGPPDRGMGPPRERGRRPPPGDRPFAQRPDEPPPEGEEPAPHGGGSQQQLAERSGHLDRAISLLTELVEAYPADPRYRHLLALSSRERARVPEPPDAGGFEPRLEQTTQLLEALVGDYPDVPEYRHDLAETHAMVVEPSVHPRLAPDTLEQHLRRALELAAGLSDDYGHVPRYRASRALIQHKLAGFQLHERRTAEAEESALRAVAIQTLLVQEFPEESSYKVWLAVFRHTAAEAKLQRGERDAARDLLTGTLEMLEELSQEEPSLWFLNRLIHQHQRTLARTMEADRRSDSPP